MILQTTVVGSYPQPGWLIHRDRLGSKVPRVRAPELWKVPPENLEEAQDDATLLAIRELEDAGIDIVMGTDAGNIGTLHGPSIHREMKLMVEAGLTPLEVLRSGLAAEGADLDFLRGKRGAFVPRDNH